MRHILLIASLFGALSANAEETRLTIRVLDRAHAKTRRAIVRAESASRPPVRREFIVDGASADVSLARGQWFLTVEAPHTWSETTLVDVHAQPQEIELVLEPAGTIAAMIAVDGKTVPREVTVYFQPATVPGRGGGSATCPVADGRLSCGLPAGTYDLAFRIPGHSSIYKFGLEIVHRATVSGGKLEFQRGSTLSGRVQPGSERLPKDAVTEVVLTPVAAGANDEQRRRLDVRRLVTRPNQRGFFVFNVPGGEYSVFARSASLVSETVEVSIVDGQESVLREALTLEPRRTLGVRVSPPVDPANRPWRVALARIDEHGDIRSRVHAQTDASGFCLFGDQLPGSVQVAVQRTASDAWASTDLELTSDRTVDIRVPLVRVRGAVRLGSEPLRARLVFRERSNGLSIPVQTREDGTFQLAMPRPDDGAWDRVSVEGNDVPVKRAVDHVVVRERDDGEPTDLTIELPPTRLEGTVVLEDGARALQALVNVQSRDGSTMDQFKTADGTFTIEGLGPGTYLLTAATRDAETPEPVAVDVGERSDAVVLTVRDAAYFTGRVRTANGPLANAAVYVMPTGDRSRLVTPQPVDPDGSFKVRLPPASAPVTASVYSPGHAFRFLRVDPRRDSPAEIVVDAGGGALRIEAGLRRGDRRPYLLHSGGAFLAQTVAYLSHARHFADPAKRIEFEIPAAAAGLYSLCWLTADEARLALPAAAPPGHCAAGTLARGGRLTLRAPE